ncbi:GlxA family transcriptional regulator [Flavisolibacter tropicus]|uniref:AraC family transcriptional regulator n=1 Tax=Flavisolibacter tropicus TaxID=1492898 RepID=A0A172TR48_9BACT|nr:helix-turn-helix domain-containing protein [Flavisolibacter tropicus]ANE49466.1 AraC family transcriptional regulator [Flavisolibacter tropicus]
MKHVSILIPQGHFSLVNVEGTHQILSWVNEYLEQTDRQPLFKIQLVGLSKVTTQTNGLFTINPEVLLNEVTNTDLVILPAVHGDLESILKQNSELIPWIIKQYKNGAEVVSYCIGSFMLAATGLLNGRPCSTHWRTANEFRRLFPEVHLMDDKIMTEADGIYTSGGAYSFTNLLIYLVEKYAGRDVAITASKTFMIDIDRHSQSPFIMFAGQKTHQDEVVLNAQQYIEQYFPNKITVDELSENFSVGRRTFERRFKKATSNTVVEYIQRVKIEAAKKQLESGRKTVSEVMYDVGYTDTKAFRDVFKKVTGLSPVEYRNKYNKEAIMLQ